MPNRRRRKLSTAMSAVAALAVASPFAVTAVSELNASSKPAPQQHDFVQAAMVTDLPGEIMSALQSSLSQFGIVVPNVPSGILGPAGTPSSTALAPGGLTGTPSSTALAPGGLTGTPSSTALAPGGLTATPATLSAPGLTATTPGLTAPTPGLTPPTANTLASPNINDQALANPALTPAAAPTPGLPPSTPTTPTTPTIPGLTTPSTGGLTAAAPAAATGINPALTSPLGAASVTGAPGEVPISAPLGTDALAGTYPILGDPSLGMPATPSAAPSGGLLSELSNAASQLGAGQAIDLLKGVVVPSIMQAIKSAGTVPAAAAPAVPAPGPTS